MRFGMVKLDGFTDEADSWVWGRGECGTPHCNQWDVCGVARPFPYFFGQSCYVCCDGKTSGNDIGLENNAKHFFHN